MKLMTLLGAGVLAAGTITVLPAEAQRYDGAYRHGRGDYGRYHGGHRGAYRGYGYRGDHRRYGYGYRGNYHRPRHGWRGYRGRPRVVCRIQRGYYGPVRRCFNAY